MACSEDGFCLNCLDFGRRLPRLPDNVKEAIASHISAPDLTRCLLANASTFHWKFTKHYLSHAKLQLDTLRLLCGADGIDEVMNEVDDAMNAVQATRCSFRESCPDMERRVASIGDAAQGLGNQFHTVIASSLEAELHSIVLQDTQQIWVHFESLMHKVTDMPMKLQRLATVWLTVHT